MALEHFLNADFDLSLRPRWQPPAGEAARRRIADLAWHALFLAETDDSVLVPEPVPDDFAAFLDAVDLALPSVAVAPERGRGRALSPFGWNHDAAVQSRKYDLRPVRPSLATVARVNGRSYSARLEQELTGGEAVVAAIENEDALRVALADAPPSPTGWVVKAEHGNAAVGNRRVAQRKLDHGDLTFVCKVFNDGATLTLEPWRPRRRDLCATFALTDRGELRRVALHETINTADGAFLGNVFSDDPDTFEQWLPVMETTVATVARHLAEDGYFGPACIDAFVWHDGARDRLRPLVELNARREISAGASALWRQLGASGAGYWRFYSRRKIDLPDGYRALANALGGDAYSPFTRRGVLPTAPLWLGTDRRAPAKAAFFFLAEDSSAALALDRRFRERFER